jgi:hypothetical protein
MNNTAANTLGYTGVVTLSQYIKGKKVKIAQVHNTGTNSLFNFLADCLCGDLSVASISRPSKIKLLHQSNPEDPTSISSVSGFLYVQTKPEKLYDVVEKNSISVVYSFVIPKEYLESSFNKLGLYADSENDITNYAAVCDIESGNFSIASSSVLVIDWALTLSNLNTYLEAK